MNTRPQSLSGGLISALMAVMASSHASAQEVAPALQFAPQPGAASQKVPSVIVMKSQLEALLGGNATAPAVSTTTAAAGTPTIPSDPIRIELSPANQGSGSGGFQLRDVTERKTGGVVRTLNQVERDLAVQEFRRSLLSKTTAQESAQ